jgi:hypothetical protein
MAAWAYNYSTDRVQSFIEGHANATVRTHIAAECKNRVPPNQVAACEAFVSAGWLRGGGTIEDFIDKLASGEMSQEEFDALTAAGGGGKGFLGSIPTVYLAAGGVGAVLLGAVLLKRRK